MKQRRLIRSALVLLMAVAVVSFIGVRLLETPAVEALPVRNPQASRPLSTLHAVPDEQNQRRDSLQQAFASPEPDSITRAPFFLAADSFSSQAYNDPAAGGAVPLILVEGLEDEFLSPHFKVEDFIARDGAPYARISPALVKVLEHIWWLADAPISVNSAYRHPARNADPLVGGAAQSQHMAGLAADIWSDEQTPGELAEMALDITGCNIGIGLGQTFLHVDLRGELASWAEEDAAMDEATFDAWVETRCAALREDAGSDLPSFADALTSAREDAAQGTPSQDDALLGAYHAVMAAFAEVQRQAKGTGAVVLDLRQNREMEKAGIPYRLSYILPESDEAQTWNLDALIRSVRTPDTFAFVLVHSDGTTTIGATSYAAWPAQR